MKMSNASEERFLIDRGTDAKRASRTSWGEESYVKVASTLSNNAHSMTQFMNPGGRLEALAVFRPGPLSRWRPHRPPALQASDRSSRPCRRTGICRVLFRGAPFSSLWRGSESHRFALRDCPTHDTIRLGTAISILTFHDPRTAAEIFAMADILSDGRFLLGAGSGYLKHEFEGFDVDPAEKRDRFDECLAIVERLLSGERVTCHAKFSRLDAVKLNVEPIQRPVPLYVAILRKEAAYHVGVQGRGLLTVPYGSLDHVDEIGSL